MNNFTKRSIAVGIHIIVLSIIIIRYSSILARGTEIHVPVQFYDPRSYTRGDYVQITYPIAQYSGNTNGETFSAGDTIYIIPSLSGNTLSHIQQISGKKPSKENFFLKARVMYVDTYNDSTGNPIIHINFGVDRYFVKEDTGRDWENAIRSGNISAIWKVGSDGTIVLKDLK